jgi:hypothetical protein
MQAQVRRSLRSSADGGCKMRGNYRQYPSIEESGKSLPQPVHVNGAMRHWHSQFKNRTLSTMLTGILREFFSNFRDVFAGGRPVCIACITVKHQHTGFQLSFEPFAAERNRLLVVMRTYNLEIHADACAFFVIQPFAASLA